jgi:ribA/ribD-fused uncharacterized protein
MAIHFYSASGEFGCFSNFSAHSIRLDGQRWPTTEHYFQAQKFFGTDYMHEIRKAKSPMIAARLGRSRKVRLRPDWESAKDNVMRKAILAKFTQHDDLALVLIQTGDEEIVEDTTDDEYWGRGSSGHGRNMLGRILMEVRSQLRLDKR